MYTNDTKFRDKKKWPAPDSEPAMHIASFLRRRLYWDGPGESVDLDGTCIEQILLDAFLFGTIQESLLVELVSSTNRPEGLIVFDQGDALSAQQCLRNTDFLGVRPPESDVHCQTKHDYSYRAKNYYRR
jgi:hypothetical protein